MLLLSIVICYDVSDFPFPPSELLQLREKPQAFQFKVNDEADARLGLVKRKIMTTMLQKEIVISFKVCKMMFFFETLIFLVHVSVSVISCFALLRLLCVASFASLLIPRTPL
jgi:hypothetical protein